MKQAYLYPESLREAIELLSAADVSYLASVLIDSAPTLYSSGTLNSSSYVGRSIFVDVRDDAYKGNLTKKCIQGTNKVKQLMN